MLENKESNRDTSREAEVKWDIIETINSSNIWLHIQVAVSSREEYDLSSLWQCSQNNIFYDNNRKDISREIGVVV